MVEVIIPVFKARDTLPKALDSLVAQTKTMFLVTLIQDCDGENYDDIVNEYSKRGLHIDLLNTWQNGGPGNARQYGIDLQSKCDYIMFMDSDDMLTPNAIQTLYSEAKKNNADLVASDILAEGLDYSYTLIPCKTSPVQWLHGKIYKRSYLNKNNIRFLEDLRLNEDSYFNLVAFNCTKKKFKIPETTYIWRYNKNSLTRNGEKTDFFKKSWKDYIYSQVRGIMSIIDISGNIDANLLAATLFNIYQQEMIALYFEFDNSPLKDTYILFKGYTKISDVINSIEFWRYVQQNLKACGEFDGTLIFFKERFNEWIDSRIVNNI